jgi:hypothetical protein
MGLDADGILFYGFPLSNNDDDGYGFTPPWRSEDDPYGDWEEFLATKMGIVRPDVPYNQNDTPPELKKFWEDKRRYLEGLNCVVGTYGYHDEPGYYVAVNDCHITAHYGDVKKLDYFELAYKAGWDRQLQHFCDLLEVKYEQPGWYLTNYLGG